MQSHFPAQAPLSQDEEMTLMAGYAAAMDASMAESPECTSQETETLSEHCVSYETDPLEGPSGTDWESQTGEKSDKASLSLCVSETGSKKGKGATSCAFFFFPQYFSNNASHCYVFFLVMCKCDGKNSFSLSHSLTTPSFLFPLPVISLPSLRGEQWQADFNAARVSALSQGVYSDVVM